MAFDTWKEKNADDREFAENRRALDEQGDKAAATERKVRASYGERRENHPQRQVHKERFT
jgi:hypothetical protein